MVNPWLDQLGQWGTGVPDLNNRQDLFKSKPEIGEPARGLKTYLTDPLQVQYAMGYKDRSYSISYDVCRRVSQQLALVAGILQVRCNQVAAFSVPFSSSKSVGYQVRHIDPAHETTKGELEYIKHLERFIYNCGAKEPNPHNKFKRDDFETLLKKLVRDSITFDQAVLEIVPDKSGKPYEFMAVDAATIRIASPYGVQSFDENYHKRESPISNEALLRNWEQRTPFRSLQLLDQTRNGERPDYVQIINGQVQNVYFRDELSFGIRNPRTDLKIAGYGYSEIEMLISTITSHLYAEEYNRRFFMQGSAPKGLLNLKGENFSPEMLEGFKRQWKANLEGVNNSWKTPILQLEQGVEWIDLHPSNREMEYGQWMEYLIKITCGAFLIDPAELNFDLHGGVTQTPLFESSQEWKLKASRDRGLKPLLRFIAKQINEHIIQKLDDRFVFDFVGLDELTEQEKHELYQEQVGSYKTLNEIRRAQDLPDVPGGDMVLNPTYIQGLTMQQQQEQQAQVAQQAQQGADSAGEAPPTPNQSASSQSKQQSPAPKYSDSFNKAEDAVTLDLDLFKSITRG